MDEGNTASGWWRRRCIWVALVLALVAGTWCVRMVTAIRVPAVAVRRADLVQKVVASGRVLPPATIELGAVRTGTVAEVRVDQGSVVKRGDVLVRIDDAEQAADVAQAKARVAMGEAELDRMRRVGSPVATERQRQAQFEQDRAQKQFERMKALLESGAVSRSEYDDAEKALALARSQVEGARAQAVSSMAGGDLRQVVAALEAMKAALASAQARLDQTRIVAPADGVILTREVEPGDVVQPGKALLTLAVNGPTQILIRPEEKNVATLRVGQQATASADAYPRETFSCTVGRVAPSVDAQRGTIEIRLLVPSPPAYLKADMTVSVNVEVGRKAGALVLPTEAVRDATAAAPWVWALRSGRAAKVPVQIGIRGDARVEVAGGLAEGDLVLVNGERALREGQRVRAARVKEG